MSGTMHNTSAAARFEADLRALVVEDSVLIARRIEQVLRRAGYEVVTRRPNFEARGCRSCRRA